MLPVVSNKEEENAREANEEVIAENRDDITIDNIKPNLETAKENSKGDGNMLLRFPLVQKCVTAPSASHTQTYICEN